MIAVAVLAILLGIGVPSFNEMIRQNRLAAQTNDFLAAAALARSEAVKRGKLISMCPTAAQAAGADACSGDDTWSNGWLVFVDENTTGIIDGTDAVIQRWPASTLQRINITNPNTLFISYRGDGATTLGLGNRSTFTVAPERQYCADPQGARSVVVSAAGRANVTRVNCPS
jgi:type IV fimbrial biogenesis protein FimT